MREVISAPNRAGLPKKSKKKQKTQHIVFKKKENLPLWPYTQTKINQITGTGITIYQWKSRKKPPAGKEKKGRLHFKRIFLRSKPTSNLFLVLCLFRRSPILLC